MRLLASPALAARVAARVQRETLELLCPRSVLVLHAAAFIRDNYAAWLADEARASG